MECLERDAAVPRGSRISRAHRLVQRERRDARGDIRNLMHGLHDLVHQRARDGRPDPARLEQVRAILRRAIADIEALD